MSCVWESSQSEKQLEINNDSSKKNFSSYNTLFKTPRDFSKPSRQFKSVSSKKVFTGNGKIKSFASSITKNKLTLDFSGDDSDDNKETSVKKHLNFSDEEDKNSFSSKTDKSSDEDDEFEKFLFSRKTSIPKKEFIKRNDDSFIANDTDEENDDIGFHLSLADSHFKKNNAVLVEDSKIKQNSDSNQKISVESGTDEDFDLALNSCSNTNFRKHPKNQDKPNFKTPRSVKPDPTKCFTVPKNYKLLTTATLEFTEDSSIKKPSFLVSLSSMNDLNDCHPDAKIFRTAFKKNRDLLVRKLFSIFNSELFFKKLPEDVEITWNKRMRTSAGFCRRRYEPKTMYRTAKIDLAPKVNDTAERVRDTLLHELCHAATWIINGEREAEHGPIWKMWAKRAKLIFPDIPKVTVCHEFEIFKKFTYKCMHCPYEHGRHSKSLDLSVMRCPKCYSELEVYKTASKKTEGKPLGIFANYVKENYSTVKKSEEGLKHGDVMKLLSVQFSQKASLLDS